MWNRRVSSLLCVVSALLPVSLLLFGCHHQHSSASNRATPQGADAMASVNGLPVQQSENYQAAVRQFSHHQYPAALASIDGLLRQPQYQQKPADHAFLLHQRAICRHAIDPRVAASVPVFTFPTDHHPAARLVSQADCGPRTLLMLCPQLGVHTTLDTLRRQAGTTAAGTTMKGLARAAKSVGLKAQSVNMDKQALKQLSEPAIAWYDGTTATTITDPNGHATIQTYNNSSQLASVTDALNNTEYYSYDGANNVIHEQDRRGFSWNSTYDGMGNVLTAADPYGNTTTCTYNSYNKGLTVKTQMRRSVTNTYDALDNLVQVQEKDADGNVLATTTCAYGTGAYSIYGLAASKTDANNHTTQYGYDANGHLNSATTPLGRSTRATCDALGFQTSRTDPMNRTTTYTPDAWERCVQTTYPDSTTATFAYDPNGNLTNFNNYTANWSRTYDADDRETAEYL